jgi:carboxyl-terminal processing protease
MRVDRYGRVFAFALEQVHDRSLQELDRSKLFEGALTGMLQQLKDEPSSYLAPEPFSEVKEDLNQQFGGIGIEVVLDPDTQQITVATPMPGTPAEEAGIRPRDRILKIDGHSTRGLTLYDAAKLMKGAVGTPVVLTVQHEADKEPAEIRIVRATIQRDSVVGDRRKPDRTWDFFLEDDRRIGYVQITSFGERTAEELDQAIRGLLAQGMQGLILDLRGNHGGLLLPAVEVCNLFISSGEIVTTRGREGVVREDFRARGQGTLPDFPMAVLVNEFSASASEIVAACLQDHERAVIVGERTFGKGTVQEIIPLPWGFGALKVTVASYWRPSGKDINRPSRPPGNGHLQAEPNGVWGVTPNKGFDVHLDAKQVERLSRWWRQRQLGGPKTQKPAKTPAGPPPHKPEPGLRTDVDPQLAKAVEYIRQRIN